MSLSGEAAGESGGVSAGLAAEAGVLTVADAWGAEDGAFGCWARAGVARAIATAAQKIKQLPRYRSWVRFLMNYFALFSIEPGCASDGSRPRDSYSNPQMQRINANIP